MLKEFDQLTTSFITPFRSFCYVIMPFGLKNVGATYQRCMLKCFGDLIRQTVEAYMDDIMVKSKWADQIVANLEQTFAKLQTNGIKLNPEKCVFRVPRGMLLGFFCLRAWHRSQPREDLSHREDGPDSEHKGGTVSYRVPRHTQPLHLAPR